MSVEGEYDIIVHGPNGDIKSHLSLHSDGHHLTGQMCYEGHCQPLDHGEVHDEHFEWSGQTHETHAHLHFTANCDDHACTIISGDVHVDGAGDFHFTGHKS